MNPGMFNFTLSFTSLMGDLFGKNIIGKEIDSDHAHIYQVMYFPLSFISKANTQQDEREPDRMCCADHILVIYMACSPMYYLKGGVHCLLFYALIFCSPYPMSVS